MPYKITREEADRLLLELAKAFQKANRRHPDVEMIIVGGGSILLNYGFRDVTDDFDFTSSADQALKDAAITVCEKYGLSYDWINNDFMMTNSYSTALRTHSTFYKSFNNGHFTVRTVRAEYLIAMKVLASREYKNDRSDMIGILKEEQEKGHPITYPMVEKAIRDLYTEKTVVDEERLAEVRRWCGMPAEDLADMYRLIREEERKMRRIVLKEEEILPGDPQKASMDEVVRRARERLAGYGQRLGQENRANL